MNALVQTFLPISKLKITIAAPDLPAAADSQILIYTDGACIGNPGPGGWAFVIQRILNGAVIKEVVQSGSAPTQTTNNRMEMEAVIAALLQVRKGETAAITIRSDSQLVINGMTKWITAWIANGWKNAAKRPVINRDLWEQILELAQGKSITWAWVKGHAGDPLNEKVDGLAEKAARTAMATA